VDELAAAWKIFTPILHYLEENKVILHFKHIFEPTKISQVKPEIYTFGSRGPASSDKLAERYGYVRNPDYKWEVKKKA
jgi:glucose-6-phosphate 1-dehydrogenase